jgi:hypothetical protein
MAPPNGDVENGDVDKEIGRNVGADNNDDLGEYGNLVKYISNYRDGRRCCRRQRCVQFLCQRRRSRHRRLVEPL